MAENRLHQFPMGDCLVITRNSLSLAARCLLCEKFEEMVPIPTELDHKLPRDPFTVGDGELNFGPHRVHRTALLRAIPLLYSGGVLILDPLDDLAEVPSTVECRMAALSDSQIGLTNRRSTNGMVTERGRSGGWG